MLLKSYFPNLVECGTDEAGRGCLAGPVTAAAVVLPKDFENEILNDSKILNKKRREELRIIIEKEAISFSVFHVDNYEIDKINILNASILAMHNSIKTLKKSPQHILVDGNRFHQFEEIPHLCIVKGDGKYLNIAAASILAKTYRDDFMDKLHQEFPVYNWKKNNGYPTAEHRAAIREFGPTPYHRKSFRLLPEQLKFDL